MKDFAIQEIEDALENATDNPDFGEFYDDDGSFDIAKAHELALKKITRVETAALVQMAFELGTLFGLSCRKNFK